MAEDYDAFLAVQKELNLAIMDVVAGCGTSFALPSRSISMRGEADLLTAAIDARRSAA